MINQRRFWIAGALAAAGGGLAAVVARRRSPATVDAIDSTGFVDDGDRARLAGYFPNPKLVTHRNREVSFYDDVLRDRSVVMTFIYTNCEDTCPLTLANLAELQAELARAGRDDIDFYALTLDPERDTPAVLAAHAHHLSPNGGFTFLTGPESDITLIRRKLGVFDPDPVVDRDRDQHSGVVVIGHEPSGRWARVPGLVPPTRLLRTIERVVPARVEALGEQTTL